MVQLQNLQGCLWNICVWLTKSFVVPKSENLGSKYITFGVRIQYPYVGNTPLDALGCCLLQRLIVLPLFSPRISAQITQEIQLIYPCNLYWATPYIKVGCYIPMEAPATGVWQWAQSPTIPAGHFFSTTGESWTPRELDEPSVPWISNQCLWNPSRKACWPLIIALP